MSDANDGFTPVVSKRKARRSKYVVREKTVEDHLQDLQEKADAFKGSVVYSTIIAHLDALIPENKQDLKEDITEGTQDDFPKEKKSDKEGQEEVNTEETKKDTKDDPKDDLDKKSDKDSNKESKEDLKEISQQTTQSQTPISIVRCLALGSPTDSHNAMYQLALLGLLLNHLGLPSSSVSCWDPVFTPADLKLFDRLGYTVSQTDPEEPQIAKPNTSATLYYVIHSPPLLTEKVLARANESSLRTVVIGNNLTTYTNHHSDAELSEKYPVLFKAIEDVDGNEESKYWEFRVIPDKLSKNEAWMTAVNDLAVYWEK
ncbi:uncharacterized protein SAPINGB_P002978 [Magnusiomyces paraingens]|uniref:SRR1-like domain-containing protein n=1 Tax=Magnusiomyces paraingens TaxID=2606893 RepID=A0A5E8BQU0_9ASCO|nr:uncharacterized protein SAPINGB_P002978 [Saprochaete ingens]VVT51083.1 unnamed protein product [Saprochaete ingens]